MLDWILRFPRWIKRTISILIDIVSIGIAYFIAFGIRYDSSFVFYNERYWYSLIPVVGVTILVFIKLGLYRAVLRYITIDVFKTVILGGVVSTISLLFVFFYLQIDLPRSVPFLYFIFLTLLVSGFRLLFRTLLNTNRSGRTRVIIYGAGESGRQLLTALNQTSDYLAIAFVDDNARLNKSLLHGVTVYSPDRLLDLIERYEAKKILLAIPSASKSRRKEIILGLSDLPCEVLSIPGMLDLVSGKTVIDSLKKVSINDLLGRDPVEPIGELLKADIYNKAVMVTGAGGLIGSELCRQIIFQKPKLLLLFELNEFSLYSIEKELSNLLVEENSTIKIIPLLGSIQRKHRLSRVMKTFSIDTIYHAAAYKHVPLVEYNVVEGIRNNIFGTLYCAEAAIEAGVSTFVLISTDKAVRPTNTMGATKRVAELILQALAKTQKNTRFCMVRFGNVLGSSGSVVPLFEQQIRQGGPITLTHQDITRYFMTIPEASQLVIQAGAMGKGGDVFVLDMGESVKIFDLAKRMVRLSGLSIKNESNPNGDIEIKTTGLRPGEKLYEELLIGDMVSGTRHSRIMTAHEVMLGWEQLSNYLSELDQACYDFNLERVRELLLDLPTSFKPVDDICDLVWKCSNKVGIS